jgi:hypothetical protein
LLRRYFVLRVSPQLRPLLIITVVVTTGTATTAIIIGITTTIIIIGTGQAIPGITAIGKAAARASEPEGLNLRLFLRHNRGNACSPCLGALPGRF